MYILYHIISEDFNLNLTLNLFQDIFVHVLQKYFCDKPLINIIATKFCYSNWIATTRYIYQTYQKYVSFL